MRGTMMSVGWRYVEPLRLVCAVIVLTLTVLNRSNVPSIDWLPNVLNRLAKRLSQSFVHS